MSMGIGVNLSDPRTAAAAARFHQLLQNGVPKEQASQIMQQEGGMIPIANLAIAYQQLQDAAKRSQVPPPSPGTVAQHIFAADAQMHGQMPPQMPPQQMPSQQMPPQMPPQQMPPQQPDPRMAGVANLPNTMGATGYKGGGIVAFAEGRKVDGDPQGDWNDSDPQFGDNFKINNDWGYTKQPEATSQFGDDLRSVRDSYLDPSESQANMAKQLAAQQEVARWKGKLNYFEAMTPQQRAQATSKLQEAEARLALLSGTSTPATANPAPAAVAAAAANPAPAAATPVNEAAAQKAAQEAAIQGGVADFLGRTGGRWEPGMVGAPLPGMGGGPRPSNYRGLLTDENRRYLDAQLAPPLPGAYGSIRASSRGGSGGIPQVTADTSAADAELARLHGVKAPGGLGDYITQISEASKNLGIGRANEQMAQYLDKQDNDLKSWRQDDRRMALANAGFKMAMAASQPGQAGNGLTQLLSAGSVGGLEAAQGLAAINKEQRLSAQRMQENRIKLAQSNELINAGYLKEGLTLRSQAVAEERANERYAAELAIGISRDRSHATEVNATNATHLAAAEIAAKYGTYGRLPGSELDAAAAHFSSLAAQGVPGAQEQADALNKQRRAFYGNGAAGLGDDTKTKIAFQTSFERLIATERGQALWRIASNDRDPVKSAAARNELIRQARLLQDFGGGAGGEAGGVTGGADLGDLFGPPPK